MINFNADVDKNKIAHGNWRNSDGTGIIIEETNDFYLVNILNSEASKEYHHISKNLRFYYSKNKVELLETQNEIILW